jgi:hypothetical protein
MPSSHRPDRLAVAFDDDGAVANAGLVLPALLAQRLGVQQLADALIDLGERPGAAHPGSKVLTLVHSLLAGGDCIDDPELLRLARRRRCWATGCWPPQPWGRSCAASPSAMSASWTAWPNRSLAGPGRQEPDPVMGR